MNNIDNARLLNLEMENVKSFLNGDIPLHRGITVISGQNGAGKSTIMESVGYCLFGVDPSKFIVNQNNFIHLGKKSAKVAVDYQGVDGVTYRVERGTRGGQRLYRMAPDGWFPVEGTEISEHLRRTLGLKRTLDLSDQFIQVIGPFQSDFVGIFLERGSSRQENFDRILGINRWRDLYKNTRGWDAILKGRIKDRKTQIEILEEFYRDLPDIRQELKEKTGAHSQVLKGNLRMEKELEAVGIEVKSLENLDTRLEEAKRRLSMAGAKIEGLGKNLAEHSARLEQSLGAREITRAKMGDFEKYGRSLTEMGELEKKRAIRDKTEKELTRKSSRVQREKALLDQRQEAAGKSLEENGKYLLDLGEKQKAADEKLSLLKLDEKSARQQAASAETIQRQVREINVNLVARCRENTQRLLKRWREDRARVEAISEGLRGLPALKEAAAKLPALEESRGELSRKIAALQARRNESEEGKKTLSGGICPFFASQCPLVEGRDPDAIFDARIDEIDQELAVLDRSYKELEEVIKITLAAREKVLLLAQDKREMEGLRDNADRIAREMTGELQPGELQELLERLQSAGAEVPPEVRDLVDGFNPGTLPEQIPGRIRQVEEALCALWEKTTEKARKAAADARVLLEDAVSAHHRQQGDAEHLTQQIVRVKTEMEKQEKLIEQVRRDQKTLSEQGRELTALEEQLEKYAGLDRQLGEVRKALEESTPGYNLYLANCQAARQVDALEERLKSIKAEMAEVRREQEDADKTRRKLFAEFDREKLDGLRRKRDTLNRELAGGREKLESLRADLLRLEGDVRKKEQQKMKVEKLKSEVIELKKTRKFASFMRNDVFRQVGQRVSRVLRESVSEIADGIYKSLSAGDGELFWGEGYAVELHDCHGGQERVRSDRQLSAGQFTSAVIALRLALLQAVGSPFAFFDEPTSNLDQERRENLGEVFRTLDRQGENRWFGQLFLVSHEESFLDISRNLIELELKDGCSRVIQGGESFDEGQ